NLMADQIVWHPSESQIGNSNLMAFLRANKIANYDDLLARAERDPIWWWKTVADRIDFFRPYERVLNLDKGVEFARWCDGATTNIVLNALDRHRGTDTWNSIAFVHEPEIGNPTTWTYAELDRQVCHLAGGLRQLGVRKGDVVAIYLPNVGEAVV